MITGRYVVLANELGGLPEAFAMGVDGCLKTRRQLSLGNWTAWTPLAPSGPNPPMNTFVIAVSGETGMLGAFAMGRDGAVWANYQTLDNGVIVWRSWLNLGMPPGLSELSELSVAVAGKEGPIQVFAIGSDDALWYILPGDTGWTTLGSP